MRAAPTVILAFAFLMIGLGIGYSLASVAHRAGMSFIVTTTTTATSSSAPQQALTQYCFSPGGDCAKVLVAWFDKANVSIHVLIYSFTLDNVRDALIRAKNRGVDVKLVMEKENANERGSEYQTLKNAGVDVRLDTNSGLMHDKVAIIDGHILLTGSMNWSNAGVSQNNENLLVLDSEAWAAAYEAQFQAIYSVAET